MALGNTHSPRHNQPKARGIGIPDIPRDFPHTTAMGHHEDGSTTPSVTTEEPSRTAKMRHSSQLDVYVCTHAHIQGWLLS